LQGVTIRVIRHSYFAIQNIINTNLVSTQTIEYNSNKVLFFQEDKPINILKKDRHKIDATF